MKKIYQSRRHVSARARRRWRMRGSLHERGSGLALASRGSGVVIVPRRGG